MPGSLGKEGCLARGPYPQDQNGEGNLELGQMKPSWFLPDVKVARNIGL